jgi:hypothetical protein
MLASVSRLLVVVVLSGSLSAAAETCERPQGAAPASVAAQSDEARLMFLSKLLLEESGRARNWTLAWGATYGVLTIAQLAVMSVVPREEQPDWYWGALSTVVGVAFTVIDPLEVRDEAPKFAQRVRAAAPDETCKLIGEGERMLKAGAEHERSGVQWYIHAANVLFNVGLGLVLGLGYGRWPSGLLNMGIGTAIGEATLFSSPTHLISGWEQYRQGAAPVAVRFHVVPTAGPGLGVLLEF